MPVLTQKIQLVPCPPQWSSFYSAFQYDAARDKSTPEDKRRDLIRALRTLSDGSRVGIVGLKPDPAPTHGIWYKAGPIWVMDRKAARTILFQMPHCPNDFVVLRNWEDHHANYLECLRSLSLQHKNLANNLPRYDCFF